MLELLRDPNRRRFLLAHGQSQLGTGAGFVALVVLAYERLHSPWAISLVLLADFLPAVLLGPVFGLVADRLSRRAVAVGADVLRAGAFLGLALVDGFAATVALALVAGVGTGLFRPAVSAALPGLASPAELPRLTALHAGLTNLGLTVGPALAAAGLLAGSPELVLGVNAAGFGVSALLLLRVRLGARDLGTAELELPAAAEAPRPRTDDLRAVLRLPSVRLLLGSSGVAVLFGAMINVAEPLLAQDELGAGGAGYAVLVAVFGLGTVAASLLGGRTTATEAMRRRYAAGLLLSGAALLAVSASHTLLLAVPAFVAAGLGMGTLLVHEAQLLQLTAPSRLAGRMFGLKDAIDSAAFATAFLLSGALVSAVGPRGLFLLAGIGVLGTGLVVAARFGLAPGSRAQPVSRVRPATA